MVNQTAKSAPKLDTATKLAYDRTRLSYENSMMSWVRTGMIAGLMHFSSTVTPEQVLERGKMADAERIAHGQRGQLADADDSPAR